MSGINLKDNYVHVFKNSLSFKFIYLFLRIERLWRDVKGKVIEFYKTLFFTFEREGLNVDNIWHIFTLQYMFMNRIQENLDDFKSIWNNHPIETEHNRTPIQLILLARDKINYTDPLDSVNFNIELNQVERNDDDNVVENAQVKQVKCDPIICPLTPSNLAILKQNILPLTKLTPDNELSDWFHAALKLVLDLRDNQLE